MAAEVPDLEHSRENVDFGKAFYVTPIYTQAVNWSVRIAESTRPSEPWSGVTCDPQFATTA